MSYNKTTWKTGDIVTAEKMNNIENGIFNINNGNFDNFITFSEYDTESGVIVLDKSYNQIAQMINNGIYPIIKTLNLLNNSEEENIGFYFIKNMFFNNNGAGINVDIGNNNLVFTAENKQALLIYNPNEEEDSSSDVS